MEGSMSLTSVVCGCNSYSPGMIINSSDIQEFARLKKSLCETCIGKVSLEILKISLRHVKLADEPRLYVNYHMATSRLCPYLNESGLISRWIILTNYRPAMDTTPYWSWSIDWLKKRYSYQPKLPIRRMTWSNSMSNTYFQSTEHLWTLYPTKDPNSQLNFGVKCAKRLESILLYPALITLNRMDKQSE